MSKLKLDWPWPRPFGPARQLIGLWLITKEGMRRIVRRRVKPRFWGFMIAVTLIVFLVSFAVLRLRYSYGARQLQQAEDERVALSIEADLLEDRLKYARTDEYVMRVARDELNMIMPGEIRYVNGTR